jgi:hypothetical protein
MKTNYRLTRKRKMLGFRLERLIRRFEGWLDEHYKQFFFWLMMVLLFASQFLLWMS